MLTCTASSSVARLLLMLLTTSVPSTYLVSGTILQRNVMDSCPTCSILCETCAMINFTCCVDPRNGVTNCVNAADYPVCPEAYCGCDAGEAPSTQPSRSPTDSPSESPTTSAMPSGAPSMLPSSRQSSQPSFTPSSLPSTSPTEDPSSAPSTSPSTWPSASPGALPSSLPSAVPSKSPSTLPSSSPSADPSSMPSAGPSTSPSGVPSALPSSRPSSLPSRATSSAPTPPNFTSQMNCTSDEMEVTVSILTDNYPQETYWEITDSNDMVVAKLKENSLNQSQVTFNQTLCLVQRKCYRFTITDSGGDGMCCMYGFGKYEVLVDGVVHLEGAEFGDSETKYIGSTEDNQSCQTQSPSSQPSMVFPMNCAPDELKAMISIRTDRYPQETYWNISDNSKAIVKESDQYLKQDTTYSIPLCLHEVGCYKFFIGDTYGDGICCAYGLGTYSVLVNNNLLASGGKFKKKETTRFFGGCSESGLSTPFDDNNGEGGNMFDIFAFTDVVVGGFHVNVEESFSQVYLEVYTKVGSYEGHEYNASAWTMVMGRKEVIVPEGGGETDLGSLDVTVTISANTSQAFYVTATENALRYTNLGVGVTATEKNEDIKISMGCGVMYPFKRKFKNRRWNGMVKYAVADKSEGARFGAWTAGGQMGPEGSDVEGWDQSDPTQGINGDPTSALALTTNVREEEDPEDERGHLEQETESTNGAMPPVLGRERRRSHAGNHPYQNNGEH